jgi:thiol-disulfide isomerase/thioredoxin
MKYYMSNRTFLAILVFLITFQSIVPLNLYDNNVSNVVNLNPKNFGDQIIQNRSKNIISIVHFYKLDDGKSRGIKLVFEKFAEENDGLFKVAAINCKEFTDICEKQEIREFPSFKVFPPLPAPAFIYEVITFFKLGKNRRTRSDWCIRKIYWF